jgi:ABC-type Na+ efflux pump permease subunit
VMVLVLIPAVMATIAVVREKETGSIANFRSTPISKFEFLVGKQFPYVIVGMLAFIILLLMALFVFHCRSRALSGRSRWGRCSMFSRLAVLGNSSRPSPRPR